MATENPWHFELRDMMKVILINVSLFVGKAMSCAIPLNIPGQYTPFINDICYIYGTYFWPLEKPIGNYTDHDAIVNIRYYPFFPQLFVVAATIMIIPSSIWRLCSSRSGYGLSLLLKTISVTERALDRSEANKIHSNIAKNLHEHCLRYKSYKKYSKQCKTDATYTIYERITLLNKEDASHLIFNYTCQKVLYVFSILIIFVSFNAVLNGKFLSLGFDFIARILVQPYEQSDIYPLFAMCDLYLTWFTRSEYSFNCILIKNVFHDFFITLTWFILALALVLSLYNIFESVTTFYSYRNRRLMVQKWVDVIRKDVNIGPNVYNDIRNYNMYSQFTYEWNNNSDKCLADFQKFSNQILAHDIIFTLILISKMSVLGDLTAAEIFFRIWMNHREALLTGKIDKKDPKKDYINHIRDKSRYTIVSSSSSPDEFPQEKIGSSETQLIPKHRDGEEFRGDFASSDSVDTTI